MSAIDPELYLRLVGERTLLPADDQGDCDQGDLESAASALVAVGLLTRAVAVAVVDEYELAVRMRAGGYERTMRGGPPTEPAIEAPVAPVVALCRYASAPPHERPPDDGWAWDVHYVVLGNHKTVVMISSAEPPPWAWANYLGIPGRSHPRASRLLSLADDTGHVEQADFTGGDGREGWSGEYTTASPLSPTTRWLEFDGRRLELVRPTSLPTVRVEDHGIGDPAERHLRQRLGAGNSRHSVTNDQLDAAAEALVAVGALDSDAPIRAEIAAVRATRDSGLQYGFVVPGRTTVPTAVTTALPDTWASVFRKAPAPGPSGVVSLGVATPVIDGAAAVFRVLTSSAEGFTVDTQQVGGDGLRAHGGYSERTWSVAWWAQDDLGQWYRGDWEGWNGDDSTIRGEVQYVPPLDPRARTLRLLPTMPSRRAVVEITLPDWGAATGLAAPRAPSRRYH